MENRYRCISLATTLPFPSTIHNRQAPQPIMRNKLPYLITCLSATVLLASAAHAVTISSFTFNSANGSSSDTETLTTTSSLALGSGLSGVTYASNQLLINGLQTVGDGGNRFINLTDNVYFSFSITVPVGATLDLDQIAFDFGYNNSAGYNAQVRSSHDSFASILWSQGSAASGNVAVAAKSADLSVLSGFQGVTNDTLEFRFYIADQSSSNTRNFIFDNISITGTAIPEPAAALLGSLGLLALLRRRR